jgi:cation diffusion facilitator CzcD-associated flavoprotein CzcO
VAHDVGDRRRRVPALGHGRDHAGDEPLAVAGRVLVWPRSHRGTVPYQHGTAGYHEDALSALTTAAVRNGAGPLPAHVRVAVIGSGFAGLGMAIRLRQIGVEDFVVLERRGDVGGTWHDNTYPGCQCDVPSHLYSFSFAPNPDWSRTFSMQPEIEAYLRRCARDFGVLGHVRLHCAVTGACWDDERARWCLETSDGSLEADVVVSGVGALSEPSIPELPGLERFRGATWHSAAWDHDHDLTGERVAVIGTGASAIQFVPRIQPRVGRLYVFQRTAPWIMPHPDRPISPLEKRLFRRVPALQRLVRDAIYWARESFVVGFMHPRVMALAAERVARRHLRRQVPDPELRRRLTPRYRLGCKRVLLSNDYLPALQQPNVELVTDRIAEVREHSIVTADGSEREVDAIVFGTGFKVIDVPVAERVRGRDGRLLADVWDGTPQAHHGIAISGFPNFFMLLGPNTGLGHTSVVFMIEAQIAYVADALRTMRERGAAVAEVRPEAQAASTRAVQERLRGSVWNTGGCASWYLDAQGTNATIWPGSTWSYKRRTMRFDAEAFALRAYSRSTTKTRVSLGPMAPPAPWAP